MVSGQPLPFSPHKTRPIFPRICLHVGENWGSVPVVRVLGFSLSGLVAHALAIMALGWVCGIAYWTWRLVRTHGVAGRRPEFRLADLVLTAMSRVRVLRALLRND
jgi:hypothetical protein